MPSWIPKTAKLKTRAVTKVEVDAEPAFERLDDEDDLRARGELRREGDRRGRRIRT